MTKPPHYRNFRCRLARALFVFVSLGFLCLFISCSKPAKSGGSSSGADGEKFAAEIQLEELPGDREVFIDDFWRWAFGDAGLPDELAKRTVESLTQSPDFVMELLEITSNDPSLYVLVDKEYFVSPDYIPQDLVELKGGSYQVTRSGLMLRLPAAVSLELMAAAALADGVTLTAGSAFRTFEYQTEVYNRNVREMGQEAADRESAKPGHSQHQLGLVVDFSPIDDVFDTTAAGIWMAKNANRFGWTLSYPNGYEEITGYRWESWHYRYTGPELTAFINKYFNGIQQYALQFIRAWIESSG